jgi:NAD+ diphosphatase
MFKLPADYASPLHLPFNRSSLNGLFEFASPDRDPGGPGVWVLLHGSRLLVAERPDALLLPTDLADLSVAAAPLYLGQWLGQPCRLLELDAVEALPAGWRSEPLAAQEPALPIELLSLGGLARQVLHWEGNSRFCSACGSTMRRLAGEWGKQCSGCSRHHFPHVHPCAIVLVGRPGEVLLTRKAEWPAGRYSLVAGFLEMGESLEETALREVQEETGVVAGELEYVGSQSWPFPSQLMAGFTARYRSGEVVHQQDELEDARWFRLDALPALPPKRSIARYILDRCVARFAE